MHLLKRVVRFCHFYLHAFFILIKSTQSPMGLIVMTLRTRTQTKYITVFINSIYINLTRSYCWLLLVLYESHNRLVTLFRMNINCVYSKQLLSSLQTRWSFSIQEEIVRHQSLLFLSHMWLVFWISQKLKFRLLKCHCSTWNKYFASARYLVR